MMSVVDIEHNESLEVLGEKMRHETAAFLEGQLNGGGEMYGKMQYPRRRSRRAEAVWTDGPKGRGKASAEVMD